MYTYIYVGFRVNPNHSFSIGEFALGKTQSEQSLQNKILIFIRATMSVCALCGSPAWPSPPVVGPLWGPPLCVGPLWVGSSSCRVRVPCGIYSRDV